MITLQTLVDACKKLGYSVVETNSCINGSMIYLGDILKDLFATEPFDLDKASDADVSKYLKKTLEAKGFFGYKGYTVYYPTKYTSWGVSASGVIKDKSIPKVKIKIDENEAGKLNNPVNEVYKNVHSLAKPPELSFTEKTIIERIAKRQKKKRVVKKIDAEGRVGHKKNSTTESVKNVVLDLIVTGASDKEIVDAVRARFDNSRFDSKHISWYRSTWFRDGVIGPEFAPRRSPAYKNWLAQMTKDKLKGS